MASYEVKLNLGGNLVSQLTKAEALIDKLQAKASGLSLGGPGGAIGASPAASVFKGRMAAFAASAYGIHNALGGKLLKSELDKELSGTIGALKNFKREFIANMFTYSGWRRNIGLSINALSKLNHTAGIVTNGLLKINPAVAIGVGALIGLGKLSHNIRAGVIERVDSDVVSRAIANRAQFNLAKGALGNEYSQAYNNADMLANIYGYDRAQSLGLISAMTGLGANPLNVDQASGLARIAGKISTLGGRPYQQVGLNLQQILSAGDKANVRDIRELLHAVPIIAKYAQQRMREQNQPIGDVLQYLKKTENLFAVLERLDREYRPSELAQAKARLDLARSDRGLVLEEKAGDVLTNSTIVETEYQNWANNREAQFLKNNKRALEQVDELSVEWDKTWTDLGYAFKSAGINALGAVKTVSGWIADALNYSIDNLTNIGKAYNDVQQGLYKKAFYRLFGSQKDNAKTDTFGWSESTNVVRAAHDYYLNEGLNQLLANAPALQGYKYGVEGRQTKEELTKSIQNALRTKPWNVEEGFFKTDHAANGLYLWQHEPNKSFYSLKDETFYYQSLRDKAHGKEISDIDRFNALKRWTPLGNVQYNKGTFSNIPKIKEYAKLPFMEAYGPGIGVLNEILGLNLPTGKGGGDTTSEIERMTRGSKALIINFNDAVVKMTNHFNTGSNARDNIDILNRELDTSISRGFQIAILNATGELAR